DLPALLCRFKKDGTIFYVNNAYSGFFNTAKENIYGTKFFIDISEIEKSGTNESSNNSFIKQFSLKSENGSTFRIEWIINKINNNSSDNSEYQAVGIDISKHKLLKEQLTKNSENQATHSPAAKEEMSDNKKSETLEKALYQISRAVIDNENLDDLYSSIHKSLGDVLPVENLFIAIYDKESNLLSFPYMVDEYDEPYETAPPGRGLTEYVLRTGKPLHVDQKIFKVLVDAGEVDLYGTDSLDWIGVPLKIGDHTIGVIVVQSYNEKIRLGKRDLNVLIYVSDQIALAIERTRTHNLLKSSEERYRLLFDKAADIIIILDPHGKILDLNNLFEEETGYTRTELIGQNIFFSEILTAKSVVSSAFYITKIIHGKDVPIFETDLIKKDGSIVTYELRGVPIREKDSLTGIQAILRNVTERKRTEAKLLQSEKHLSNLMSNLPGMAYIRKYSSDWIMEFVSQGCFELTGFLPDELIHNKVVTYAELIHPEDKETVFVSVREAVIKKKPYQIVYRIRTKNEGEKWVWEKGTAQFSRKGKVETLEGFITDISSRIQAESALRENEELYRKLIATLPDIIAITNLKGELEFLNEVGIRISGYSDFEEIKQKSFLIFIAEKDKERAFLNFKKTFVANIGPQVYTFENTKGEQFLFEIQKEVLKSIDGTPYGLIFSCRDITGRKKAETELAQSEEKYRTLIDSIQDGVFLIVDGMVSFVNRAFKKMIGYDTDEIQGQPFTKFISPEDLELVKNNYKLRQEGQVVPAYYEWRMLHKNGSRVFVNMSARVINYQNKKATIGTLKDITLQKELEHTLLNQKNLFKGIADAANILLTERDFNLAIRNTLKSLGESSDIDRVYIFENNIDEEKSEYLMNQKYEWTNGSISSEINNPDLQSLSYFPMFEEWYPVLKSGGIINSLIKDLNPALRDLLSIQKIKSILLVPIMVKKEFWGFIGFDYCKSDRVWSESEISTLQTTAANLGAVIERELTKKELIEAKETAEEMSKLKSNFLANMSHELRTPLIAILGYTEILKTEIAHYEWNEMISTIMASGKRLLETLNLILDLSKVEADKVQVNYNELNIAKEITDIINLFSPVAQKKNLYIKSQIESDNILARLDKRLFHSVISNLVNNAIKYTDKGGVEIKLNVLNSNGSSNAMINVIDTGIGIAMENQETIFDEFRQVSEGYNRYFEGAGLGLTIAKKFAEKMGGSISLQSEQGKGSTFTVVFPVERSSLNNKVNNHLPAENDLPQKIGRNKKVLVIDDDYSSRKIVELFLRGEVEIEAASTDKEGFKLMNNNEYSLILLDISLGKGTNGIDVLGIIRENPNYKNTPVIAVTAHAMVGDREKFINSGFTDYLSKPFAKRDLISKVRLYVSKSEVNQIPD
ncbi:MAG: PAS domain S-box protein, partial [Ignavibacteriaceae bacterium]|nr:PAS domain S-box protein [Ignavibacteriaceae bacterium]